MDDNSSNDKVVSSSSPGNIENQNIDDQNVVKFVQTLMDQMQSKFQDVSDQIVERIDEMSGRIDDLEHALNELMDNAESNKSNKNQNVCSSSKD